MTFNCRCIMLVDDDNRQYYEISGVKMNMKNTNGLEYDKGFIYDISTPIKFKHTKGQRVEYQERVWESIQRVQFLRNFTIQIGKGHGIGPLDLVFDETLINQFMGYKYAIPQFTYTSKFFNGILEEAEKRGDI